jgi:ribonuclease VapC
LSTVVDASAVIAVVLREPGWAEAAEALPNARISTVNLSEMIAKLVDRGWERERAASRASVTGMIAVDFDTRQSVEAGWLRSATRSRGLSLGDRACLALAMAEGARVLTADRAWAGLDLGIEITVLR